MTEVLLFQLLLLGVQTAEPSHRGIPLSEWREVIRSGESAEDLLCTAIFAVGQMGPAGAPAIPELVAEMRNPRCGSSMNAAHSLARIGPRAVPALVQFLDRDDEKLRVIAAVSLLEVEPEPVDAVIAASRNPSPGARSATAYTLSRLAHHESAWKRLEELFEDPDNTVRFKAAQALGSIDWVKFRMVAALKKMEVHDDEAAVREQAASSLGLIRERNFLWRCILMVW